MTIYEKLLEVQKEIGAIKKDEVNPFFKSAYFDINGLLAVVKPVLNKHGLILTQALTSLDGKLALATTLCSVERLSGAVTERDVKFEQDIISATCPLPETTDAQKAGSAITYFRRYALQSLLALEAIDDDANIASTPKQSSTSNTGATKPITKSDNFTI
jgi:hypothetical protein